MNNEPELDRWRPERRRGRDQRERLIDLCIVVALVLAAIAFTL